MNLTQMQERFVLNLFQGMSQREAYIKAGYSGNMAVSIIDSHACALARSGKVKVRLAELNKQTESTAVATVEERKQFLTKIIRTKMTDFMEVGQDGSWVNLGAETPKTEAISEIHSRTEYDDNGSKPTVYTSIKLHDPIKAVDLLNKMDNLYQQDKQDINVNVDNRKVEIIVATDNARQLTERILNGERTDKIT